MSFLTGLDVAASGLSAQRTRLNVTASNLANAETTRAEGGGPYRRQQVVFESNQVDFGGELNSAVKRVQVQGIEQDTTTPTNFVYDPGHVDADGNGYVEMPNVNVVEEMTDMIAASRSYEASATAFDTLKKMALRALSIG